MNLITINQKNWLCRYFFINKDTSIKYKLNDNSLEFFSEPSKKNNYKGKIDFKPFYLSVNFFMKV